MQCITTSTKIWPSNQQPLLAFLYCVPGKRCADRRMIFTVERFDCETNQWTEIDTISLYSAASFTMDNKIYITGGSGLGVTGDQIHVFDPDIGREYEIAEKLPARCVQHVNAHLILPQLL